MATTVAASFTEFAQNLEVTALQSNVMSTRQREVRSAVEAGFVVEDAFLTGSYAKSTLIAPLADADIDIFMVLNATHFHSNTPSSLLTALQRVLHQRYPLTGAIHLDGQAVTIAFSDFSVDVVPAFVRSGGGYLIPNANTGVWIPTDPKVHLQVTTRANNAQRGMLVPLVKMVKAWNRHHGSRHRGFYLELMTMKVFDTEAIGDYASGIRRFFDRGREEIRFAMHDPAGFGDQVTGLRGITIDQAVGMFERAYDSACAAEQWSAHHFPRSAVDEWKKLLGPHFPAYG